MKNLIIGFFFITLVFNCEENTVEDCEAVSCIANASEAYYLLLDSAGNNVFSESIYNVDQIVIKDSDNQEVNFLVRDLLNSKILQLKGDNWDIGKRTYKISIGNSINFTTTINLERTNDTGCCGNILFIKNIETTGITSTFNTSTKICTITIP